MPIRIVEQLVNIVVSYLNESYSKSIGWGMSRLFAKDKEEFDKNLENIREFLSLQVQYALMKVGPHDHIQVECKQCRHRTMVEVGKSMGVESVVEIIMKWVRDSEIARHILLAEIADAVARNRED